MLVEQIFQPSITDDGVLEFGFTSEVNGVSIQVAGNIPILIDGRWTVGVNGQRHWGSSNDINLTKGRHRIKFLVDQKCGDAADPVEKKLEVCFMQVKEINNNCKI